MAMVRQLWSITGLSTELGIDRRTLGKKLSNLPADGEGTEGGKTVRRWRLARVLKHLKAADRTSAGVDEQLIEDHKYVVTQFMFPALISSRYFLGFFVAYLHEDIGLTKVQALRAYQTAVLALQLALGEFYAGVDAELAGEPLQDDIEDHQLEVQVPPELRKLGELGPEGYAARSWPAGPA